MAHGRSVGFRTLESSILAQNEHVGGCLDGLAAQLRFSAAVNFLISWILLQDPFVVVHEQHASKPTIGECNEIYQQFCLDAKLL